MSQSNHILLITRNLPPLIGGMETLMLNTAKALNNNFELTVIAPKGCRSHLPESVRIIETPSSTALFLIYAFFQSLFIIFKDKNSLVIGGSGLVAPILRTLKQLCKVPTICFVHGLDIVVNNSTYKYCFKSCLKQLDLIIANSQNTKELAIEAGVSSCNIQIINPGCDANIPENREIARKSLCRKLNIDKDFILLYVGRITPRKGLSKFLEEGFNQLLQYRPDCKLLIAGDSADQSLTKAGSEKQKSLTLIRKNQWQDKVLFLGKVSAHDLEQCYLAADCVIFPLTPIEGDVEGFGMVAIEAAAHGTMTVAFDEGGVRDAIQDGVSGYLITSGDYSALAQCIASINPSTESAQYCREFAQQFDWSLYQQKIEKSVTSLWSNVQNA